MLYEGATGATEKELEQILQLPVSRQATRDRFQQILNSLQVCLLFSSLTMTDNHCSFIPADIIFRTHLGYWLEIIYGLVHRTTATFRSKVKNVL